MSSPVLVWYKVNRIHKVPPHLSCLVSSTLLYCCAIDSWALSCNTVSHTICWVSWVSVTGLVESPEEPQLDCIIKRLGLMSEMHSSLYYECQNVAANCTDAYRIASYTIY